MMRNTPLAVWASGLESAEDVYKAIVSDVSMTHPNRLVHSAIFLYALSIKYLLNNKDIENRAQEAFKIAQDFAENSEMANYTDPHTYESCSKWLKLSIELNENAKKKSDFDNES